MEYKLILSGPISKEVIEKTATDWLRGSLSEQFGVGPAGVASRGIPTRLGYMLEPPPPLSGMSSGRGLGSSSYPTCVPPPADSLFSSHQLMHRETTLVPGIRLTQLSEMGRGQVHTFVLNDREVLVIHQAGMHQQWVRLQHGWESTHQALAQQAVGGSAVSQSDWERIKAAMASGIRQMPGHIAASLTQLLDSLLTWEGMLLIVAVTALFVLGGEVALLVMGAFAVYDLLMNVLPLLVQFYHAAIAARTPAQTEAAGALFAQALLRGALDVIDVVFAAGAYRRILTLGGGRLTLRAVLAYLAERVNLLMARLRQGAGRLQQLLARRRQPARLQADAPPANMDNAAKGVYGEHVSDVHMQNQGHTKLNDGGTLTPSTGGARGTGIDGVWRNATPPPEYIITEAKYGSSRLGDTADGRQMSDDWIRGSNRLDRAVGTQEAQRIRAAMRRPGGVQKQIHRIDPQGNITVNEVDRSGNISRQLHP